MKDNDNWKIFDDFYDSEKTVVNGNKYLIGNGYIGFRGTLDEETKDSLVALNLPGFYDQNGDKWRESVNSFNPFYTYVIYDGVVLRPSVIKPCQHNISLDMKDATFSRDTTYVLNDLEINIRSKRFVSFNDFHKLYMQYEVRANKKVSIEIRTGIDLDIWDINGPHLVDLSFTDRKSMLKIKGFSNEKHVEYSLEEKLFTNQASVVLKNDYEFVHQIMVDLDPFDEFTFEKAASIYYENINNEPGYLSFNEEYSLHKESLDKLWDTSDIVVNDEKTQLAIRYSIYHLLIIAPYSRQKGSIPARGLSSQVYKGAIFWDTEMFMLPFFLITNPSIAKTLIDYRISTLKGAKDKALEFGYDGAFYAWESQNDGFDACSLYNVTDVFTKREMRTFFKDKQIHISGDVVYGLWKYINYTKDLTLLIDGGFELIIEVCKFYYSYIYYHSWKKRYEVCDVTGPDEYHERVNNNAYTNRIVKFSFDVLREYCSYLTEHNHSFYLNIVKKTKAEKLIASLPEIIESFYVPCPNENGIIEQFDGYFKLEDISVEDLKKRILHPNEYFGGANGIATRTKIIKQADVAAMLYLFNDFDKPIKNKNFDYYYPKSEHGSSLSASMYGLLASQLGKMDIAYDMFFKSAMIDYYGGTKNYAGDIYIGGTHPASSGGAYMIMVNGFAGLQIDENGIHVNPNLPKEFSSMMFKVNYKNSLYKITINGKDFKCERE